MGPLWDTHTNGIQGHTGTMAGRWAQWAELVEKRVVCDGEPSPWHFGAARLKSRRLFTQDDRSCGGMDQAATPRPFEAGSAEDPHPSPIEETAAGGELSRVALRTGSHLVRRSLATTCSFSSCLGDIRSILRGRRDTAFARRPAGFPTRGGRGRDTNQQNPRNRRIWSGVRPCGRSPRL